MRSRSDHSRVAFRSAVIVITAMAVTTLGTAGSQATEPFVAGRAQAGGAVVAVVPVAGSARLPITLGLATSSYASQTGVAESTTADLGLVGTVLTLSICGGDPLLRPDQLPQPLHVDSIGGPEDRQRSVAGAGVLHGGRESASAGPGPIAHSSTEPAVLDIPGVVRAGGVARSHVRLLPDERREAGASVDLAGVELLNGLVVLSDLRWEADHASGADDVIVDRRGSFSIGGVKVGGIRIPGTAVKALDVAVSTLNRVLGPIVVTIELPREVVHPDGSVEITPLAIKLSGGETAARLLVPILTNEQATTGRRALADALLFGGCEPGVKGTLLQQLGGATNTVVDVFVAAMQGSGGISIELGGARAGSDGTVVESVFTSFAPRVDPEPAPLPSVPTPLGATGGDGIQQAVEPAPPPPSPAADRLAPDASVEVLVPASRAVSDLRCLTSHPAGSPRCSTDRGTLAVVLAGVVGTALIGADLVARRRRPGVATTSSPSEELDGAE